MRSELGGGGHHVVPGAPLWALRRDWSAHVYPFRANSFA
jgi:hypothetical protein